MDLRFLGPIEGSSAGLVAPVNGGQVAAVLARLAIEAGRAVSPDVLANDLFGEDAASRRSVKTYVSRLRSALEAIGAGDRIRTTAAGYVLALEEADTVDLREFERLVDLARSAHAEGEPSRAADAYARALALWRGAPFGELRDRSFLALEAVRLDELRLSAVEGRVACDLALGHAGRVVPELEVLTQEHPLRERFWAQLMLALYRTGRQGDALRAFAAARRVLVDELGVEPGTELRDIERRILQHDPTLVDGDEEATMTEDRPAIAIVLVDDHPMWRDTVAAVLARAGHRVTGSAGTVREAVAVVGAERPDVIVMDVDLPDGSGVEAVRQVVTAHPTGRVLMLTASTAPDHVLRAVQAGAIGYLVKDASPAALVEAVERAARGEAVLTGPMAAVVLEEIRTAASGQGALQPEERSILRLLGEGKPVDAVAVDTGLTEARVRAMLADIVDRLHER
jgi:DNA-binding NarL/FixJ family response regulator/DNA-binding SARP family transcriptional activator